MDGDKFINGLQSLTDKAIEAAHVISGKPKDLVAYVTFDMEEVVVEYNILKGDYPDETAERFKLEDIVYKTVGKIAKECKEKEKAERAMYEKLKKKYEKDK